MSTDRSPGRPCLICGKSIATLAERAWSEAHALDCPTWADGKPCEHSAAQISGPVCWDECDDGFAGKDYYAVIARWAHRARRAEQHLEGGPSHGSTCTWCDSFVPDDASNIHEVVCIKSPVVQELCDLGYALQASGTLPGASPVPADGATFVDRRGLGWKWDGERWRRHEVARLELP